MQIREAKLSDISGIIKTLKASLGETSSEKTEAVWRYKHVDNPFGRSLVLVAEEKNEIIGVRAFMRWNWQVSSKIFSAYRAVDTATHPQHQGKGIFKRLTLKALEVGSEKGDHFVFNTPNSQSKPGYLKMGWNEVSKLRSSIIPVNPWYWNKKLILLFTPKSKQYLEWRYMENPMQPYLVESNTRFFISGYVKEHKNFREFRIAELITPNKGSEKEIRTVILGWAKKYGVQFISVNFPLGKKIFNLEIKGDFGPVLTFRPIDGKLAMKDFLNLKNWAYSLGDLELF